jgi:predicted nucleotidyltransferase
MREDQDPAVGQQLLKLATQFAGRLQEGLGESLVSAALFGSVARGEATRYSDIDLLIVIENLPRGRFQRLARIEPIEATLEDEFERLQRDGIFTRLTSLLKTPKEAERFIPLYLDMVQDAIILFDKEDFLHQILDNLRQRLERLGARRLKVGRIRYWDLKPDLKPGEFFQI